MIWCVAWKSRIFHLNNVNFLYINKLLYDGVSQFHVVSSHFIVVWSVEIGDYLPYSRIANELKFSKANYEIIVAINVNCDQAADGILRFFHRSHNKASFCLVEYKTLAYWSVDIGVLGNATPALYWSPSFFVSVHSVHSLKFLKEFLWVTPTNIFCRDSSKTGGKWHALRKHSTFRNRFLSMQILSYFKKMNAQILEY